MHAGYTGPVKSPKRPKARWYLLAPLALLAAVGFLISAFVIAIWQDKDNLTLPAAQIKLTQSRRYDVLAQAHERDHIACTFTPPTGGPAFTQTFQVPDQPVSRHHRYRHHHLSPRWTNHAGSFTARRSGTYRLRCTDAGKAIYSFATAAPRGITALIWATVLLGAFAILWPIFVFIRRRQSRDTTPWPVTATTTSPR